MLSDGIISMLRATGQMSEVIICPNIPRTVPICEGISFWKMCSHPRRNVLSFFPSRCLVLSVQWIYHH